MCCVQGLTASSVQWGAWQGGGMAASDATLAARLQHAGLALIKPHLGLAALGLSTIWPPQNHQSHDGVYAPADLAWTD